MQSNVAIDTFAHPISSLSRFLSNYRDTKRNDCSMRAAATFSIEEAASQSDAASSAASAAGSTQPMDSGAALLASLAADTSSHRALEPLTTLRLQLSAFTLSDVKPLSLLLTRHVRSLTHLDLSGSHLGADGLQALGSALCTCGSLATLVLADTALEDDGAMVLAKRRGGASASSSIAAAPAHRHWRESCRPTGTVGRHSSDRRSSPAHVRRRLS